MEAYDMRSAVSDDSIPASTHPFDPRWKRFHPVEDLLIPALTIDAEGTIQHASKAARRLLEYTSDAALDSYFFSHVHGKNMYRVMQDVAHMVGCGKQQATWLLRLRTGHGRWRWYRATAQNRLHQPHEDILVRLAEV